MSECDDNDQQDVVLDSEENAIAADSNSEPNSASEGASSGWTRVLAEQRNGTVDSSAVLRVDLAQRPERRRTHLDAIRHQPRSAFT